MPDEPRPPTVQPSIGHQPQKHLGLGLNRLRQQAACPRSQDGRQRIIDLLGLPETNNGAILVHGVSLRLEVLAGWLPASIRHLPQSLSEKELSGISLLWCLSRV